MESSEDDEEEKEKMKKILEDINGYVVEQEIDLKKVKFKVKDDFYRCLKRKIYQRVIHSQTESSLRS